jgi:hypothetical protein
MDPVPPPPPPPGGLVKPATARSNARVRLAIPLVPLVTALICTAISHSYLQPMLSSDRGRVGLMVVGGLSGAGWFTFPLVERLSGCGGQLLRLAWVAMAGVLGTLIVLLGPSFVQVTRS